ncbi:MAG: tRNA-dihydrouridine synthase [bacterium]|nr:tRNA-dihydrouridine synthase [bacterium]
MRNGFWGKLKKPFFVLAPMLDITDAPFRQIVALCGKPDVFYTWFVSVDGLCSSGKNNILSTPNLSFTKKEKPIAVQLFGKDPKNFFEAAKIIAGLGFDGIDINMGCPDKDVVKQGAGASLMKDPKLAREIIRAAKKGAPKSPISVKTRIGYHNTGELENWISELLQEKPAAICVHGRTAKQKYGGKADWNSIGKAVKLARGGETLIIGNGDVKNLEDGKEKAIASGVDGVMIGRAVLGNMWILKGNKVEITKEEKLKMLVKHARLFEKYYKDKKSFGNFRKYLKCYVSEFQGSKELRMKMMEAESSEEICDIIIQQGRYSPC